MNHNYKRTRGTIDKVIKLSYYSQSLFLGELGDNVLQQNREEPHRGKEKKAIATEANRYPEHSRSGGALRSAGWRNTWPRRSTRSE